MKNLLLVLTMLFCEIACFSQTGNMDSEFGNRGFITSDFNSKMDIGRALAIQPDGKIIVAGYCSNSNGLRSDFALVRYNYNGTLDNSFGTQGKQIVAIGQSYDFLHDNIFAIALQSDGKIVVAGVNTEYIPAESNIDPGNDSVVNSEFAIVRLLENGEFDTDFGVNGIVVNDFGYGGIFRSVSIQPDGKILAAGDCYINTSKHSVVFRFNSNGSIDNSFGENGIAGAKCDKGSDIGWSLIQQPDKKILLAGDNGYSSDSPFIVMRFDSVGTLDSSFNDCGIASVSFGNSNNLCNSVLLQSDGKIVLSGYAFKAAADFDFALARLNPDGTLDNTFGTGGKITTNISKNDQSYSAILQPDGKIILAGYTSENTGSSKFALVRYNTDGSLDNQFGDKGISISSTGIEDWNYGQSVKLQQDGKILLAGYSRIGANYDFILCRYINDINVGIIDFIQTKNNLLVYPNPLKENCKLRFELKSEDEISIFIVDMNGKILKTFVKKQKCDIGICDFYLNFLGLKSGCYLISIQGNYISQSIRVVK